MVQYSSFILSPIHPPTSTKYTPRHTGAHLKRRSLCYLIISLKRATTRDNIHIAMERSRVVGADERIEELESWRRGGQRKNVIIIYYIRTIEKFSAQFILLVGIIFRVYL